MSLKRNRSHYYGFSNIDFRTKQDKDSINLFQPWINKKDFGTMGNGNYIIPSKSKKEILKISKNINKLKNNITGIPDAKTYNTCKFYNKNNIIINVKKDFFTKRYAELDESEIGKEQFNGDSMMIADLIKARKNLKMDKINKIQKKGKLFSSAENILKYKNNLLKNNSEENIKFNQELSSINKEKEIKNENEKEQENNKFLKEVDLKKIQKIRDLLRKRYSVKSNVFNVYRIWSEYSGREINLIQVHNIINKFGIPINYNETKALIASVNDRGTDNLNLNEFINLIFKDNPTFNIIDQNLEYKDEEFYKNIDENKSYDKLNLISERKYSKNELNQNIHYLEKFIKVKASKLSKIFRDEGIDQTNIVYNTFINSLRKCSLPEKYFDENIIKGLMKKYLNENNKENLNFQKLFQTCLTKLNYNKSKNDFFKIQNEYAELLGEKLKKSKSEIFKNKILKNYENQKEETIDNKKIKEKNKNFININKNYDFPKDNEINSMQPSTEFLKKIYSRNEQYKKIYDEIEKSFIPFPSLYTNNLQYNIKSNRNLKTSINIFKPDISSSMYINETDRFKVKSLNDKIDFLLNEKNKNNLIHEARLEKIRTNSKKIEENIKDLEMKEKQKIIAQQIHKIQRIYNFEKNNNLNNQLNEDI